MVSFSCHATMEGDVLPGQDMTIQLGRVGNVPTGTSAFSVGNAGNSKFKICIYMICSNISLHDLPSGYD